LQFALSAVTQTLTLAHSYMLTTENVTYTASLDFGAGVTPEDLQGCVVDASSISYYIGGQDTTSLWVSPQLNFTTTSVTLTLQSTPANSLGTHTIAMLIKGIVCNSGLAYLQEDAIAHGTTTTTLAPVLVRSSVSNSPAK
jgi:hypothetical protein